MGRAEEDEEDLEGGRLVEGGERGREDDDDDCWRLEGGLRVLPIAGTLI